MSFSSLLHPLKAVVAMFRWTAADLRRSPDADLFASKSKTMTPSPPSVVTSRNEDVTAATNPAPRNKRWVDRLSLFRWLPLGNRRKSTRPWVQTEMLLQETKPLRHDLSEEDVALVRRQRPVLIYESQPAAATPQRFNTENAYSRLRNRAPLADRIVSE
jgi:hypothetical protein